MEDDQMLPDEALLKAPKRFPSGEKWSGIPERKRSAKAPLSDSRLVVILLVFSICSLAGNIWLFTAGRTGNDSSSSKNITGPGLSQTPKIWRTEGYWHPEFDPAITNESHIESLWLQADGTFGIVAIDDQVVNQHQLGSSMKWPFDESKSLYIIPAYHALHCTRNLRLWMSRLFRGETVPAKRQAHLMHCFEIIRTEIMCMADDTLLVAGVSSDGTKRPRTGYAQERQCTDWEHFRNCVGENTAGYVEDEHKGIRAAYIKPGHESDGWLI